ncbi:DUF4406 domain-containing protein [Pseudomonas cremoricolorata]|uniref:DUF4406 domain-containing protein n=1 Tax=Pseudomonas cremoricolorata TaxID=157783 RepID=UPI000AFF4C12|nr:DUF4406 domain-containing protein [Pseudomonas cremoricolorata]
MPTENRSSAEARAIQLTQDRELRVYIAGPMTGLPDFNFPAFNAAADLMRSAGWHVENPAEHGVVPGAEWADYLRYDIARLATCEMIMLLPGWSKSKGANLEVAIAQQLGMPIKLAEGAETIQQHQGEPVEYYTATRLKRPGVDAISSVSAPWTVVLASQYDDHINRLQALLTRLSAALQFYADREHFHFESSNWDTVSGEPLNILWCGDEPDFIEDGTVARNALSASAEPSSAVWFQSRVQPWLMECFGEMIAGDREERNHRFLEEALELVQALGATADEAHQLVDYVFGRAVGEPAQEVGGVMVTLAALCLANGLDMHQLAETELARIWTKVEQIRAKQTSKPQFGPLPGVYPDRKP